MAGVITVCSVCSVCMDMGRYVCLHACTSTKGQPMWGVSRYSGVKVPFQPPLLSWGPGRGFSGAELSTRQPPHPT